MYIPVALNKKVDIYWLIHVDTLDEPIMNHLYIIPNDNIEVSSGLVLE
jgi:hypothetical protein